MPSKLSTGQVNAILRFGADQLDTQGYSGVIDGILYAHNGVQRTTAGILVQRGLAMWTHKGVSTMTTPGGRTRSELDWGIELTPAGWAKLFELNPSARTR
jgi:hypothetical protein